MKQFLGLFAAFTIGALACQLVNDRKISDLKAGMECAYHTGLDEGYNTGMNEARHRATTEQTRMATQASTTASARHTPTK